MFKSFLITCAALLLLSGAASSQSGFDNTGRGMGLQVDLGLGFTSGLDKELVEKALGVKVDMSSGATLRFGVTGAMKLMQGFYLRPTFQLSFFSQEVDLSKFQDNQGNPLDKLKWSHTDINFGVLPTYYLRFANSPVHPFGGLGLKLHFNAIGQADLYWKSGEKQKLADSDSKFGFGIAPFVGAELKIGDNMAIPLTIMFDMNFNGDVSSVFYIGSGFTQYF